jgi:hypothetical protein
MIITGAATEVLRNSGQPQVTQTPCNQSITRALELPQ